MTMNTTLLPYPNATQGADLFGMFQYANSVSDNIFMPVIELVLFCIIFLSLLIGGRVKPAMALTFASFVTTITGIILATLNMLAPRYMYISIILLAFGVLWLSLDRD